MKRKDFDNFFEPYSKSVDRANDGFFWILNNKIIKKIINNHIPQNISKNQIILDAGGGTGRWICDLAKTYKNQFILYDLSDDMLKVAKKNIKKNNLSDRVAIIKGNMEDMGIIKEKSIDFIISIYNPISFVSNKDKAIKELYRTLKKNGLLIIMGQGFYNALSSKINNYVASPAELSWMDRKTMVRWNDTTPELHVFSKETMEKLLEKGEFEIIKSYGVPVFIQPGPEDFGEKNPNKSRISKALMKDKKLFQQLFDLEMKYNSLPSSVNRGMNIVTVAKKIK